MKIKIEFTRSRSGEFDRVLALVRRVKSFKEFNEKGTPVYSVEFDGSDLNSAQAIMDLVKGWKSVLFYMDGKLVPRFKATTYVWDRIYADYEKSRKEFQKRSDVDQSLKLRKNIREANSPRDLIHPPEDTSAGS